MARVTLLKLLYLGGLGSRGGLKDPFSRCGSGESRLSKDYRKLSSNEAVITKT